jgi:phosphopantetheinyl transferase (holo-ACP synthase)
MSQRGPFLRKSHTLVLGGRQKGNSANKQVGISMTNQARFTINSLLEGKSGLVHITPVARGGSLAGGGDAGFPGSKGLGLEIENIAALPDAEDYTQHEFYVANFTPSEIAYCTKQPKTKAAFQGLLAAKRAIIKSGAVNNPPDGHRSVEISFDGEGRPAHPGCLLSISHTDTLAAAVCFWLGGLSWPAPATGAETARSHLVTFPLKTRIFAFLILLSLLVLFALGLLKLLEFMRH